MSRIVPYRSSRPLRGFGALGTSDTVNQGGQILLKGGSSLIGAGAGSLIGVGAGTVGGALFGAAAGSVVPVIGTIIGAVVGILTSKLFGHANYAAVYANIANVASLFNAYEGVAGQYPGRMYGWPELQYIWHGALVSGLFPGNGPPPGVACTQAMISNKINACGTGQWIDDLLGSSKPTTPGANNIAALIASGLARGIVDPITMTDSVLLPGMESIAAGKNNGWISVTRSANPSLYRQLLMDTADYMMSTVNPQMPVYYGPLGVAPNTQMTAQPTVTNSASLQATQVQIPVTGPALTGPPQVSVQPVPGAFTSNPQIAGENVIPTVQLPPQLIAQGAEPAPVDATAAYIAQLQAQGASQAAALQAAVAQLQAQGLSATGAQSTVAAAAPSYYDPSTVAAATPQAVPVTPTSDNTILLAAAGLGLLMVLMNKRKKR